MIDSSLTIAQIREIANELGIKLKNKKKADLIKELEEKAPDKKKLEELCKIQLELKKKQGKKRGRSKRSTGASKRSPTTGSTSLTKTTSSLMESPLIKEILKRLDRMETQIKYILAKVEYLEQTGIKQESESSPGDFMEYSSKIREILLRKIQPKESLTVDQIYGILVKEGIPTGVIENSLQMLIDEEIFDGAEGKSTRKISGYIGRLIRR